MTPSFKEQCWNLYYKILDDVLEEQCQSDDDIEIRLQRLLSVACKLNRALSLGYDYFLYEYEAYTTKRFPSPGYPWISDFDALGRDDTIRVQQWRAKLEYHDLLDKQQQQRISDELAALLQQREARQRHEQLTRLAGMFHGLIIWKKRNNRFDARWCALDFDDTDFSRMRSDARP